MSKNPALSALSLVSPSSIGGPPPRDLGRHGRALWDQVHKEYRINDRGGIELLLQACAALDLAEALSEAVSRDGAVVYTEGGPRVHPAVKDQIQARVLVIRSLKELGNHRRECSERTWQATFTFGLDWR